VVGSLGFEPRIIGDVSRNSHFSFLLQFYIIGEVTARANRHLRNQLRCIFCLSELFNRKDSLCSMIAANIL